MRCCRCQQLILTLTLHKKINNKLAVLTYQFFNFRHADFFNQGEACVKGMDAGHIRTSAFKTPSAVSNLPVMAVEVVRFLQHVPAVLLQVQYLQAGLAAVKQRDAFRAHHPFVSVGHYKISVTGLYVEYLCAKTLDGVYTKEDISFPAGCTKAGQVKFQSGAILNRTD